MIDFKATHDKDGKVVYMNDKDEVSVTYPMSELEQFVADKGLAVEYETHGQGGTGMVCDPNSDFWTVKPEDIPGYIDDNWFEVTEQFFHFKNHTHGA